jgi:glyoxylase-like metal-dependent hydrolase (beta-lactamase superfamily II)
MEFRAPARVLSLAVGGLLGVSSAGAQEGSSGPLVRENATVKLGQHTYVIPDNNVGAVPNVGIVVGTRAALVIDPGLGRRNGETVLRELRKLTKTDEIYVVSTHFHPEHTTGYLAFPTAKYVNSKTQEEEFAQSGMQSIKTFAGRTPLMGELLEGAQGRTADITFDREHTLDLGGATVRMVVVGPTHTRGDTAFFVEPDGVLFSGDVVMNSSFLSANQNSSFKAWIAALDLFEKMEPNFVVPAHGRYSDHYLIWTQRRVMQAIADRALEHKAAGRSEEEAGTMVQKEFQSKWPTWPRANGIAALARSAYREAETP